MLLMPPPLEQRLPYASAPPKVLLTTHTGKPWYWLKTRNAAPPRSGPSPAHTLRKKRELTTLKRPPRTQIAPPPENSASAVESASTKLRFCTVRRGVAWLSQ